MGFDSEGLYKWLRGKVAEDKLPHSATLEGSMLYHQTKDILHVKEFLGHRKIDTTTLYIQLEQALFRDVSDEFTVRVASTQRRSKDCLKLALNTRVRQNLYYSSVNVNKSIKVN